jgi:hypothetical protein
MRDAAMREKRSVESPDVGQRSRSAPKERGTQLSAEQLTAHLDQITLQRLQRMAGNAATAELVEGAKITRRAPRTTPALRQAEAHLQRAPAVAAPAVQDEQKLSALRTIALSAIDVYQTAAADGVGQAVAIVGNPGWRPFGLALAGNLIWAAACFTTGGAAFAISVAGIGVGAIGSIPAGAPEFKKWAEGTLIAKVVADAKGQVDTVTRAAAGEIESNGWDDNKVRHTLLMKMFRPEYIETLAGDIPNISRDKIEHRVNADVLIRANRETAEPRVMQNPGFVRYVYGVNGYFQGHGRRWYYGDNLDPLEKWKFTFKEATVRMDLGGDDAVAELKKDPQIEPATMPFDKLVVLESEDGDVVLVLDANNVFFEKRTASPMWGRIEGPEVLARLWPSSGGKPPPIATSSLT